MNGGGVSGYAVQTGFRCQRSLQARRVGMKRRKSLCPVKPPWRYAVATLSMLYGIIIRMMFMDTQQHNLPHLHVEY